MTLAQIQVEIRKLRKLLDKEPISWYDVISQVDAIDNAIDDHRDTVRQIHLTLSDLRKQVTEIGGAT